MCAYLGVFGSTCPRMHSLRLQHRGIFLACTRAPCPLSRRLILSLQRLSCFRAYSRNTRTARAPRRSLTAAVPPLRRLPRNNASMAPPANARHAALNEQARHIAQNEKAGKRVLPVDSPPSRCGALCRATSPQTRRNAASPGGAERRWRRAFFAPPARVRRATPQKRRKEKWRRRKRRWRAWRIVA